MCESFVNSTACCKISQAMQGLQPGLQPQGPVGETPVEALGCMEFASSGTGEDELPVVARVRFKMMGLAYKAVNGTAPAYLRALVRPHTPARVRRSTTSNGRLVPPSLRAGKSRSLKTQLFSVMAPRWWNELPAKVRTAESLTSFCEDSRFRLCIATQSQPSYLWNDILPRT